MQARQDAAGAERRPVLPARAPAEVGRISRPVRVLLVGMVALPLLLYLAAGIYLRGERLEEGMDHVRQTVRTLEEHALRVFEAQQLIIDLVDNRIAGMRWDEIRASEELHLFLKHIANLSPHVDGLWLIPPDGRTANSADFWPMPEVDVKDREYFRAIAASDELHFGEMIVGRTKGNFNFNLSRRRSPRETFDGLILVTASIDYFTDVWASATGYPAPVAGLFRPDGEVLARYPMLETLPDRLSAASPLRQRMLERQDAVYRSVSTIDGGRRIYGYSFVGDYPVVLGFGVDEAAVLAPWREDVLWHGMIALTAAALLGAVTILALRQSDQLGRAMVAWRATAGDLSEEVDRRIRAEDVAAEKERLLAQIRDVNEQRRTILDNMIEGVVAYDAGGLIVYSNGAAERILRLGEGERPAIEALAREGRLFLPDGEVVPPERSPVARLMRGETLNHEELRIAPADGSEEGNIVCSFLGAPLWDEAGRITGAVLTFSDVTERKAEERRRTILMAELDHRVRNMLATIVAMVRITSRAASSQEALAEALLGRVGAMVRTHGLLTDSGWRGVTLGQIVRDEVQPYGGADRIRCRGPEDIVLSPKQAVDMGLVVHELATNAAKYGAWSNDTGRVEITWERIRAPEPAVRLVWRESGGPPVEEPGRRGFGTTLLRSVVDDPQAVSIVYEPGGVVCDIRVPIVGEPQQSRPAGHGEDQRAHLPSVPAGVEGMRILVVEDEPVVQMELEDLLTSAGALVIGPAGTVAVGRRLAVENECDAAVLDVSVAGESVGPLAEWLDSRGTPIVLATGYRDASLLPEHLRALPLLQKPVARDELLSALSQERARRSRA